jgi:hypothetical protein
MRDLAGHDRKPSAFLLYLFLWCSTADKSPRTVALSLQQISDAIGLSKRTVQESRKLLVRRRLISVTRKAPTAVPVYQVKQPWVR